MSLKYVSAYLMAVLSGKENPETSDVTNILSAVAADVDDDVVSGLVSQLEGKSVHEVIASGMSRLGSVATGPVAPAGGDDKAAGGGAAAAPVEEEEKAPEPEEEEEEEDLGFSLFD